MGYEEGFWPIFKYFATFLGVIFSPLILLLFAGMAIFYEVWPLGILLLVMVPVVFMFGVAYFVWRYFGAGAR